MIAAAASPVVSVIIPTRDRLHFLKEAVGSVLAQTLPSCEAVVVDDASSDGTVEWLETQDSERVIIIHLDEHVERAIARNRGLERARGDFVLFLDDDDRLRASALERLRSALRGNAGAIGAVGARVLFNEHGHRRKLSHPRRPLERMVWLDLLAGWMSPPGTVLWRTEVVRAVGGWNEAITFSGDRELFLRASRQGPVVFIPHVVLDKRAHSGQRRDPDIRERKAQWMREFVNSLPPKDSPRARSAMSASRSWNDARIAYGNLRAREALSLYIRAVRTTPLVVTSPLLRPEVGRGIAKALLAILGGNRAILWARSAKRRTLRMLGREVYEAKQETDL